MAYFYEENPARSGGAPIDFDKIDAVKVWATHYGNRLMLEFLEARETDGRARADLRRELTVCQRKLAYWEKHPNWNAQAATAAAGEHKKAWRK